MKKTGRLAVPPLPWPARTGRLWFALSPRAERFALIANAGPIAVSFDAPSLAATLLEATEILANPRPAQDGRRDRRPSSHPACLPCVGCPDSMRWRGRPIFPGFPAGRPKETGGKLTGEGKVPSIKRSGSVPNGAVSGMGEVRRVGHVGNCSPPFPRLHLSAGGRRPMTRPPRRIFRSPTRLPRRPAHAPTGRTFMATDIRLKEALPEITEADRRHLHRVQPHQPPRPQAAAQPRSRRRHPRAT